MKLVVLLATIIGITLLACSTSAPSPVSPAPNRAATEVIPAKKEASAVSFTKKADEYYDSSEWGLAIENYTKAIQLDPNNSYNYYNRGNAYTIQEQYQLAIDDFTMAIQFAPDDYEAYYNRGNVYSVLGESQTAINDYTKAIELNPEFVPSYHNRGVSYGRLGNFEAAISDINMEIQVYPDAAEGYALRGKALESLGKSDLANEDYDKACQLDSSLCLEKPAGPSRFLEFGEPVSNDIFQITLVKANPTKESGHIMAIFEVSNISANRESSGFIKFDVYEADETTWLGTCSGIVPSMPSGATWKSDTLMKGVYCLQVQYRTGLRYTIPTIE